MNIKVEQIWEKIKSWSYELYLFLTSKIFLTNFGKMLLIVVAFLTMTFWFMKCYTNHGESSPIGKYENMPLAQALAKIKADGFDYIIVDSTYKSDIPTETIRTQDPAAGTPAKAGRRIYLGIYTRQGRLVTIPDIAGNDDYENYSRMLVARGITPQIIGRRADAQLDEGTILEVWVDGQNVTNNLKNNIQITQGKTIQFVVSTQQSDNVQVPNLVCSTYDGVAFALEALGLKAGVPTKQPDVTDEAAAFIWKQEPAANATVPRGTTINVYLAQKRPADCQ